MLLNAKRAKRRCETMSELMREGWGRRWSISRCSRPRENPVPASTAAVAGATAQRDGSGTWWTDLDQEILQVHISRVDIFSPRVMQMVKDWQDLPLKMIR